MQNRDKTVGIIGYWFATNYGGVASYYSLYKTIESLGFIPVLIETPYLESDKEGKDTFSRKFFREMNAKISACYTLTELTQLNDLADTFVLGSDQVLTSSSIRAFGKLFLMEFAEPTKKKIAISASCGGDNLNADNNLVAYAGNQLRSFEAVSVREYSAVEIVKNKFGIGADVIIDPIFFTSQQEYRRLARTVDNVNTEPYLLAYILDPTSDKKKAICNLAAELKLNIKIALDGRKYTHDKNRALMEMDEVTLPELEFAEWISCFCNASYVITDSFHGAAMSIILNKQFIMYANYKRGYPRFLTLAQMFDLKERLIDKSEDITERLIYSNIDYEKINQNIQQENYKAEKWLSSKLAEKKEPVSVASVQPKDSQRERMNQMIGNLYGNPDFIKIRILATLLRDYGIKHIVLSPGGRDVPLVRMFEYNEGTFVLHRVTDERSAAYFGLGIASQLRQPVVCVCTSGTAVSNYMPAVTEAYYTGIPLIVVTADRQQIYLNHGEDQTIPQRHIFDGVIKKSITVPEGSGYKAEYQTRRDISDCILEATHNSLGPVHINIAIDNITIGASVPRQYWSLLPHINPHILRVGVSDGEKQMLRWVNSLKASSRILLVYGQNPPPSAEQKRNIEAFAAKFNCVIITDFLSNLDCAYSIKPYNMLNAISQSEFNQQLSPDILVTVGGKRLMNDPLTYKIRGGLGNIRHWSVIPDGRIKDFYFRLTSVIEASQDYFFEWFANHAGDIRNNGVYFNTWKNLTEKYDAPQSTNFNSQYIQSKFLPAIPENSLLHLGVGQSFFDCRRYMLKRNINVFCNMGTNGIDGCTSTFMGQCSVVHDKMCFLLVGDLSFFYDMNSIWNKQLDKNIRILMVNNNGSGLLRSHNLKGITSVHNTSAKGWVESTGFEYIVARSKEELQEKISYFVSDKPERAVFFEVFCD